jgi:hypothetical protein
VERGYGASNGTSSFGVIGEAFNLIVFLYPTDSATVEDSGSFVTTDCVGTRKAVVEAVRVQDSVWRTGSSPRIPLTNATASSSRTPDSPRYGHYLER